MNQIYLVCWLYMQRISYIKDLIKILMVILVIIDKSWKFFVAFFLRKYVNINTKLKLFIKKSNLKIMER